MKKTGFIGVALWFAAGCGGASGPEVTVVSSSLGAVMCTQTLPILTTPPFSWEFPLCRGVYEDLVGAGVLAPSGTGVSGDAPDLMAGLAHRLGQGVPQRKFEYRAVFPDEQGKEWTRLFELEPVGGAPALRKVRDGENPPIEMAYEQTAMGARVSEVRPTPDVSVRFGYRVENGQVLFVGKTIAGKDGEGKPTSAESTIAYGPQGNRTVPTSVTFAEGFTLTPSYRTIGNELVLAGFQVHDKQRRAVQTVSYEYQVFGNQVELVGSKNAVESAIDASGKNKEWIEEQIVIGYRANGGGFLPATVVVSSQNQKATTTYEYGEQAGEMVLTGRKVETPESLDNTRIVYRNNGERVDMTELVHEIRPVGTAVNTQAQTMTIRFK